MDVEYHFLQEHIQCSICGWEKAQATETIDDIKLPIILLLRLDKGCVKINKMFRQEQLRSLLKSKQRGNYIWQESGFM